MDTRVAPINITINAPGIDDAEELGQMIRTAYDDQIANLRKQQQDAQNQYNDVNVKYQTAEFSLKATKNKLAKTEELLKESHKTQVNLVTTYSAMLKKHAADRVLTTYDDVQWDHAAEKHKELVDLTDALLKEKDAAFKAMQDKLNNDIELLKSQLKDANDLIAQLRQELLDKEASWQKKYDDMVRDKDVEIASWKTRANTFEQERDHARADASHWKQKAEEYKSMHDKEVISHHATQTLLR